MSLWTPGGEVPVDRNPARDEPARPGADAGVAGVLGGPDLDDLTPEERERLEAAVQQMAEAQQRIAASPGDALVANHLVGFYELAAIKLSTDPPLLADARLAIDAMAAVLDAVGDRLGDHAAEMREALRQLRLAYVERSGSGDAGG